MATKKEIQQKLGQQFDEALRASTRKILGAFLKKRWAWGASKAKNTWEKNESLIKSPKEREAEEKAFFENMRRSDKQEEKYIRQAERRKQRAELYAFCKSILFFWQQPNQVVHSGSARNFDGRQNIR